MVVVVEEVEGEEVKQHERLQHTKASTGPVHPPGCKKSDRQRARGRGCLQEVRSCRGGCDACERGKAFEEFKFNLTARFLPPIT